MPGQEYTTNEIVAAERRARQRVNELARTNDMPNWSQMSVTAKRTWIEAELVAADNNE